MNFNIIFVLPGPSSQTSPVILDNIVNEECKNISFFDVQSPNIELSIKSTWDAIANEVLNEKKKLWDRLAEL